MPNRHLCTPRVELASSFYREIHNPLCRSRIAILTYRNQQYLRCTVSNQQKDWVDFLAMTEFEYNNSIHGSTKVSPFFANYGFHPRFSISIPANSINLLAKMGARTLQDIHRDLSLQLRVASKQYKDHVDRHRLAAPRIAINDMVWLLLRHIATTRLYAKLKYKKLGPFHIIERINPVSFRLVLPPTFRIHNVVMSLSSNSTILLGFRDDNLVHRHPWNYRHGGVRG